MLKGWTYYSIALKCIWKYHINADESSDQFHVASTCFISKVLVNDRFPKKRDYFVDVYFSIMSTCNNTLIVPLLYNAIYTQYWQRNCLLPIADYHYH